MAEAKPDTVSRCFAQTAARHPARAFLNVLPETAEIYRIAAGEISYGAMAGMVEARRLEFVRQGYGPGHRVGLLVENRPEFFIFWLALNGLGVSVVPINPDCAPRNCATSSAIRNRS